MARTCLRCGGDLPAGCSPSVSYCIACREYFRKETMRRHYEEYMRKQANRQEYRDRQWCKECRYRCGEYGTNLCDYIIKTGHRRGCKPGEGCAKREI